MTNDTLSELNINHANSQIELNKEVGEVDIVVTHKSSEHQQPMDPIQDRSKGSSAQIILENTDNKHHVAGVLDDIQSKLSNYPLPTPEISKMTPPSPPSIP